MNTFMLLQTSPTVAEKSADMLVKDPHGAIITLVSVPVVFAALVILYFAYTFIGKLSSGQIKLTLPKRKPKAVKPAGAGGALDQEMNGEVYAAIGMAMHQYLNDTVHDMESYIITIRRK